MWQKKQQTECGGKAIAIPTHTVQSSVANYLHKFELIAIAILHRPSLASIIWPHRWNVGTRITI